MPILQILGAEFAKAKCRIWQIPNLTSDEFAFSAGAEFDRCRVVLYPLQVPQNSIISCKNCYLFFTRSIFISIKNILSVDSTTGNGCISTSVLKMEINNNRQLINSIKQLNPYVSSWKCIVNEKKISHRAN